MLYQDFDFGLGGSRTRRGVEETVPADTPAARGAAVAMTSRG